MKTKETLTTEDQDILNGIAYPAHETWPDYPQTIEEWNKQNSKQIHEEFEEEERRLRSLQIIQNAPIKIQTQNTIGNCAIFKPLKRKK